MLRSLTLDFMLLETKNKLFLNFIHEFLKANFMLSNELLNYVIT
jgi:hypothetical protein